VASIAGSLAKICEFQTVREQEQPQNHSRPSFLIRLVWAANHELHAIADFFVHGALFRVIGLGAAVFGFAVVVGTAWQILNDSVDRNEERLDRAWARLLRPSAGNTGKGRSFQYLWSHGETLSNVDLSCRAIGQFNENTNSCTKPAIFSGLHLARRPVPVRQGYEQRALGKPLFDIVGLDVSYNTFDDARFDGITTAELRLTGATIFDSVIVRSVIYGEAEHLTIVGSSIADSKIYVEGDYRIISSEISNTFFVEEFRLDKKPFIPNMSGAWAWADRPPRAGTLDRYAFVMDDEYLSRIRLCRPPVDDEGRPVDPQMRAYDPKSGSPHCEEMSIEQSKRAYPRSYLVTKWP
jgi:hypothetical protein